MEITYYEVVSATDERASTVVGRYLHKQVAEAIARAGEGWYGSKDWVTERTIFISEATTVPEATTEKVLNSAEFKQYLALHKKYEEYL